MIKCGKFAVDCVSNGFTSWKCLLRFNENFCQRLENFECWEEKLWWRNFFFGKKRIDLFEEFLEKMGRYKTSRWQRAGLLFCAIVVRIWRSKSSPQMGAFLPTIGRLSSCKNDIGSRFRNQFVNIARMARVAKMAEKPIWSKLLKWFKWPREPKWPKWSVCSD